MHVTRVELENIKSYERAEFSFEPGTTAIVGPNGAGKTTILEAIAWTLFDTLDYSKDDFLRRGAKKGSVRVTFESDIDGRRYTVYRDTANGYYIYDPELKLKLEEKKANVAPMLGKLLGIEAGTDLPALFKSAIGVPQGLLTADFLKTSSQRKAAFDRLLKVEEYREGAERLRDTVNLIRDRVSETRERIGRAEGTLARYEEMTAEHKSTEARARELTGALAALQQEVSERKSRVAAFEEAERRVTESRTRADRADVERKAAERSLAEVQSKLAEAERARQQQQASESDYRAHLDALAGLSRLEAERAERDRLLGELNRVASLSAAAEADVRRLTVALEAAGRARALLAEIEREVGAQEELERERERLRELRSHALAAREQLARLDAELNNLRAQHAQTREQLRQAERAQDAPQRVAQLESEQLGLHNALSRAEKAATDRKHLTNQRRDLTREIKRLQGIVSTLERQVRDLETRATGAERAAELEASGRELAEQSAHLRAEIARDEKMRAEVKGGLCPILSERCLNIGEGQTLEGYFKDHLTANRAQLQSVQAEATRVEKQIRAAREAGVALVGLERERAQLAHERELLRARESLLATLDRELAALPADDRELDELRSKLIGVDADLINARESLMRYAELEPLRARLKEIEEEGKRRKEARAELAANASAIETLERDIAETDARLRALNDPRARLNLKRAEAEQEATLQAEVAGARDASAALATERAGLETQSKRFQNFDAEWTATLARRDATAPSYRVYLESASLAATVGVREQEVVGATDESARAAREAEAAQGEHAEAVKAYDRAAHSAERDALALALASEANTSAKLEHARETASKLAADIARLDEVRARWQEEIRAQDRLKRLDEATEFMRDILKKAGPEVTRSYVAHISVEANQFFREITGDAGRTLRWSSDYEIMLEENGHERSFVNLSGGEQMVAALSVRLALLKQLSDIRIAFFDEPTVNMDAERRENLARQIGQVRHFNQLFVISHDDTFEEAVDHVLILGERNAAAEATA
ncbi:MAG TPA: SMC family ATPase [Pyrinomonadaceae bacterium]|jgi:exonuclease SbcC|nr:SMC family ATPase [Pyrinomonadaceae bacterium]